MKKTLILMLMIIIGYSASAQQKDKTNYMTISILQQGAYFLNMIVTRTDSAQVVQTLKIKVPITSVAKFQAEIDGTLLTLVRPYYNTGWKLVNSTVDNSTMNGSDYNTWFIYNLSKEK
jgi:hypothetical protein